MGVAGAQGTATNDGIVLIGGLKSESGRVWTVVASPPLSRSGTLVGADGFVVGVDGEDVAASSRPRSPSDLTVAIVVQAGVNDADLRGLRGAAAAALLGLPRATHTVVVAAGDPATVVADAGTDREAAAQAIGEIRPAPGTTASSALSLAAEQIASSPRKAIILFGPFGFVPTKEIAAVGRRLVADGVSTFSVTLNGIPAAFDHAVLGSGGQTRVVDSPDAAKALEAAGQSIATQLATQYLVSFTPPTPPSAGSRISVTLRGLASSTAPVPRQLLPGGASSGTGGRGGGGGLSSRLRDLPLVPIGAGAGALVVLAVVAVLLRRRRRARAGPAFRVRTTQAVVARAEPAEPAAAQDDTEVGVGGTPGSSSGSQSAAKAPGPARHRSSRTGPPRTGQVDDALDRLEDFASKWQPRSQAVFFADEAAAIHRALGTPVTLDELSRANALNLVTASLAPAVRTMDALRWSLVRRSRGARWSDIAVEASAVLRGELEVSDGVRGTGLGEVPAGVRRPNAHVERWRGRRALEDEVPVREPVRAAAIAREQVLEYQWFGAESEVVSRILVPVLLYDRVPASVPYLAISRHLGEGSDVSAFYEAVTEAADEAMRRVIQLRALRTRYQAELDAGAMTVVDLLFSVPVVTAWYLAERLDAPPAKVTELMDNLVSAGVAEAVIEPTRRGDPAWVAVEVLDVFSRSPDPSASITLTGTQPADDPPEAEPPDRSAPRRRAAPIRPRPLRARPRH
jgi:hypothetical protein